MGYDKCGLGWKLWGNDSKKPEQKDYDPSESLGHGWSATTQNQPALSDETEPVHQEQPVTCTLKNARFLPDELTGFNKPCKIVVDVEGTPSGPIRFALWATYKGNDYDLRHENTAYLKDGEAQVELKLLYVNDYYDDTNHNGEKNTKVDRDTNRSGVCRQ
jgi:hypothetical protein